VENAADNTDVSRPEWPELPGRFDFEVRASHDPSGTGGVLPEPGRIRPCTPDDALGLVQVEGFERLELRSIEFLILAVAVGLPSTDPALRGMGWRAAEILAKGLPLYLPDPTPLSFRAAAIAAAIKDSQLRPVGRLWRLNPGEEILRPQAGKIPVVYLPLAPPGWPMAWRIVPEDLGRSPVSLVPWNWTWDAYLFGYLIPAACAIAKALQDVELTPALSLDHRKGGGEGEDDDASMTLHERVSSLANTPARAFRNIARDEIIEWLSPRDQALYIVFHEYECELKSVRGRRRDTLGRAIRRMRARVRAQGHGYEDALEALEEIQGFNPLELPRRPGDPRHSQSWKQGAQALRRSSVDLGAPKMPSGKLVHPLLAPHDLKSLQKELKRALCGEQNLGSWNEGLSRNWATRRPPAVRPDYYRGLKAFDPHFHLDTCPCGGAEWVRGGMCWAYHRMMCPSSPTVEQGVFFDGAYHPYACACGSTKWVRGGECWECRQRKEADMSVALLEEVRQDREERRESEARRREFETALMAEVRDLYRMVMVAFWGRPPAQEAEDILAQEGEVEAS
jgi:hypothetical protein